MTYLDAYILMPMPWFQCLGFDTLIPMLYESIAIRQVWYLSPNNVKRQCLKTWFLRLLGLIFSLKVSSWKVSVPEKKKKVKLYLYSHHFLWFHITHYLTNTWQKISTFACFFSWQPAVWMNSEELNNPCKSVPMNKWLFHPFSWAL